MDNLVDPAEPPDIQIVRLKKISAVLMRRVETQTDRHGAAYSQFERAVVLEDQVRRRTEELERALKLQSRLIGVNNRNLRDFSVSFERTYELVGSAPSDCTFVAESGLNTRADLDAMAEHGVRCFLIGESLMRQADVAAATLALVQ